MSDPMQIISHVIDGQVAMIGGRHATESEARSIAAGKKLERMTIRIDSEVIQPAGGGHAK